MTLRGKITVGVLALLLAVVAGRIWLGMRAQPQLPADDEVFTAVDGLFTAVTARDASRLAACQRRLAAIHHAGKLPGAAWKRLQGVIAMSERGEWEPAAQRLYHFMQGQRREGGESQTETHLTAMRHP
jgi:hypothetical protein